MYGKLKLFFGNGETERETSFGIYEKRKIRKLVFPYFASPGIYIHTVYLQIEIDDVGNVGVRSGIQS